mgnify:FL=1
MKKLVVLFLAICLLIPAGIAAFADAPAALEAPQFPSLRMVSGAIHFRYTIPQSVVDVIENEQGDLIVCVDYKLNDGPWHYDDPVVTQDTYDIDDNIDRQFVWTAGSIFMDDYNAQEENFVFWDFGYSSDEEMNISKNKYTFRARFAFYDYDKGEYVTSPWSEEVSIGGSAGVQTLKSLEAPADLKVEVKVRQETGLPYFYLTWTNPKSVIEANRKYPISVKVDMKVGDGKWISETINHDWWGSDPITTQLEFDPIVKEYVDHIEVEENTYYLRIMYAFEEYENKVYSPYSNTVAIGVEKFFYSKASSWAEAHLKNAWDLGIITDRLMGEDMTQPITREEFAEIAVKFYEIVTGKKATVGEKTFPDTNNPEILKAANVGIVAGGSDGTFNPKGLLQRQQMATMIVNTLQACYPNIIIDTSGQPDFKDQAQFANYAIERAKFMAKYGIAAGDGTGNFLPTATCTRQEAITFLVKAYDLRDTYKFGN